MSTPAHDSRARSAPDVAPPSFLVDPWYALTSAMFALAVLSLVSRQLLADSFMNLYAGRWVVAHGLPHHDPFTLAGAGRAWFDQQWLANVCSYGAWNLGGYAGLAALNAVVVAGALGLLAGMIRARAGAGWRAPVLTIVGVIGIGITSFPRAQGYAYLLAVLTVLVLLDDTRRARPSLRLAWIVVIFVVWANVHGSLLLFAPLVAGWLIVRALTVLRRNNVGGWGFASRIAAAALVGLSPLCTPYGWSIVRYYRAVLHNPVLQDVADEWHHARVTSVVDLLYLVPLALVVLGLGRWAMRRQMPTPLLIWMTVSIGIASVLQVRHGVWLLLVALPLLAELFHRSPRQGVVDALRRPNYLLLGVATALAVAGLVSNALTPRSTYLMRAAPHTVTAATRAFEAHPDARVLADEVTAPALLWQYPSLRRHVEMDARFEVFSQRRLREYFDLLDVRAGWSRALADVDVVVVSSDAHPRLIAAMRHRSGWRVQSHTSDGDVFARTTLRR